MRPLRVFIVDDDADFAGGLANLLKADGHHVEIAHTGEEALTIFAQRDFDISFIDVRLPGMDGVESFFHIRKIKPDAKAMMMTAYSVEQLLNQAIEAGALGVLHKPFSEQDLLRALSAARPAGIVLVADDDPEFSQSVKRFLGEHGYNVHVARSGSEAVERILANGIDVLILDLRLPVLSGLEVYLELKKADRTVPTIIVTGYAAEEADTIDTLNKLSVAGCLVKPFEPSDLLEAIKLLLDTPNAKFR